MTSNENSELARLSDEAVVGMPAIQFMLDAGQSNSGVPHPLQIVPTLERELSAARQMNARGLTQARSPRGIRSERQLPSFQVLGNRVHAIKMSDAVDRMRDWIENGQKAARYVAVTGMHGIAESMQNRQFRQMLNTAGMVVPDGMPLVWLARLHGFPLRKRVCGSELMDSFCQETGNAYRHFFYGGTNGVADKLAKSLHEKHGIVIAGTYTPPFRPLTAAEEKELAAMVKETAPDVLWVGLSTPKQEKWMFEHRNSLKVAVMLGVGAAFDMNSGGMRRAPEWMRSNGLEWLFRLVSEPRRLWKRYLVTIPRAVWFVCLELLRFPKLPSAAR